MYEKKLKIAFIDYVLKPDKPGRSGLSDIVWDMASELVNLGHEPHIIASYNTTSYPDERVVVHNFKTPPFGYRNIIGQLLLLFCASQIAKKIKPDIIHAPEYVSTAVFSALNFKIPLVLTVPGNVYQRLDAGQPDEGLYFSFLKWAAKKSAGKCARIIAISKEMKKWWEWTGSRPENTIWIPLGVNTNRFHHIYGARKLLGIPNDKLIFLYAGRFSKEKGLLDLLEAIKILAENTDNVDVEFILIGDGPLRPILEKKINLFDIQGKVFLCDWVDQEKLITWYSAADAYILPSYTEGFSRTIPEAMICGTPVIGTKITGTEDHIIDLKNGFLFSAHDIDALAKILISIVNDPKILLDVKKNALLYAHEKLSWAFITKRITTDVYYPIIS